MTKYGGNNYRYFICLAGRWDPANPGKIHCYGPEGIAWARTPAIITVWRKLWVFRDNMPGMVPDTSLIPGLFDDGFMEIEVKAGTSTRVGYWLDWLNFNSPYYDSAYGEPHGEGVNYYSHHEIPSRYGPSVPHPPNPLHSLQSQGVEILALFRCGGQAPNRPPQFVNMPYGVAPSPPSGDNDHTFVPVDRINRANDPNIICDPNTDRVFSDPYRGINDNGSTCQRSRVPEENCIGIGTLLTRSTMHEAEHLIVNVVDDLTDGCDFSPSEAPNMDLIRYGCLFDNRFGGYLSLANIRRLRQGSGKQ